MTAPDIGAEIADLKRRINRLEAALDEMAKGAVLYLNDKRYDQESGRSSERTSEQK